MTATNLQKGELQHTVGMLVSHGWEPGLPCARPVLLVTDGIAEAVSSDGTPFGVERTLAIVRRHQQETPDAILDALFDALTQFCERTFRDDLTAVVIKAES